MTKSPLDLAVEGLYRKLNQHDSDISVIPEVTRPVARLYTFQGMVDNGGFRYPLENNMPGQPPYSVISDAYRAIGAHDAAEAFDKAVALFPFKNPERDADARNEFMPQSGEVSEFNELSNRVCGDDTIWTRMDEYVTRHHADFAPFMSE